MLKADSTIQRRQDLVEAEVDLDIVILSIEQGQYYNVHDTAREIWQKLAGPCTVNSLVEQMAADYQVEPETCRADILPFLEDLLGEGLIEIVTEKAG